MQKGRAPRSVKSPSIFDLAKGMVEEDLSVLRKYLGIQPETSKK